MIVPGMVADREHGEQGGDRYGADARRGAQPAEAFRAEVQDLLGVDRQQGDDAAHQHGEEVERYGAQDDFLLPDEAEALEHVVERGAFLRRAWSAAWEWRRSAARRPA